MQVSDKEFMINKTGGRTHVPSGYRYPQPTHSLGK